MTEHKNDAIKFAFVEAATNGENFVLCIGHADDNGKVKIDVLNAHCPPFNATVVIKKFAETLRAKGIDRVMSDRHSSHYAKEEFARHCITYEFAELTRPDLKREFIALMNSKRVVLPQMTQDGELRKQMQSLLQKKHHGGADDLVVAVGGVCLQALGKCAPVRESVDYA